MKKLRRLSVIMFCILFFFFGVAHGKDTGASQEQAVRAARQWLELIDKGQYKESWDEAAALFARNVSKQQWQESLEKVRLPLGERKMRKVASVEPHSSLPGAPDGHYMVIRFAASFSHKKEAIETVTPMLESDGKWRVAGYYIQ